MPTKRKALSKKTRFDVFKRDGFKCQYCGAHPPGILLVVDHVRPVADGGENEADNLVTACEPCNQGKGARLLTAVPETLAAKAKRVAESEAQLLGYQAILEARRERREEELWRVAEIIEPGSPECGMKKDWLGGIERFIDRLGLHVCLDAADKAAARFSYGGARKRFLYFCGICWNLIRAEDAAS